jgi:hypothetical protein
MTIDARDLMIPQPEGSNVYVRPLSRVVWFAVLEAENLIGLDSVYETRWTDHMPRARRLVHPS